MSHIEDVYIEGESYLKQLQLMNFSASKLGNDIIYQMLCISAESMLTALLLKFGSVVEHGSVTSMLRALSKHVPVRIGLMNDVRVINRYHVWCSLEKITAPEIQHNDLQIMMKSVMEIQQVVKCHL